MKILIASDTFIFQTSGAANVVISLSDGLRRRGHDVRVLAPSDRNVSFRDGDNFFIRSHQSFLYPDVRMCFVNKDPLLDEIVKIPAVYLRYKKYIWLRDLTKEVAA